MKKYFERSYQEEKIVDDKNDDHLDYINEYNANRKAKILSTGLEWIERKKEKQGEDDYSIFGKRAVKVLQESQEHGAFYEAETKVYKNMIPKIFVNLEKKLTDTAKKYFLSLNQEKSPVYQLFYSYLYQVKDIDQAIEQLSFDYYDQDEEMNSSIGLTKNKNTEEYERKRQEFIAKHIAGILSTNYAMGDGPKWENKPIFIDILKFHVQEEEEKEQVLLKQTENYKNKLKEALGLAIRKEKLPVKEEIINERLDNVQINIVDGLTASLTEIWGDYDVYNHSIRIASHVPKESVWAVYVHEALHAISGQIETVTFSSKYPTETLRYDTLKVGMNFDKSFENQITKKIRPNFRWLNEAITESLALEISKSKDIGIYKHERELLDLLIKFSGISPLLIHEAYFENYEGENLPDHPTPALKKLFDFTNEKLGKRFLIDLDLFIQFHDITRISTRTKGRLGVKLTVEKWNELGSEFPQYLYENSQKIRDILTKSSTRRPK